MSNSETYDFTEGLDIAIIGMAGRFPEAKNLDEFWQNLRDGIESISFFTDEELEAAGVYPAEFKDPHYVGAGGVLENVDLFDASFFGFYPREAALMDPQHRLFLESAWEALENAGYDPESYEGLIGVYAGVSMNTYLLFNLFSNLGVTGSADIYPLTIGNDKDFLPTRVSYKLNLRGPSVNIQTACSTSLVATHLACQSLLNYQCDMALAGGVAIRLPQKRGYLYQEGGIASPDGHCRAFDARAQGTIGGNGVAIVVLKRLADALADGDYIRAVIKGSAINNDGSLKVGYTAPSVDGQADVIAMAQAIAGIDPETINYIEAHGTGTSLGDPIEIAALTQVFRASTQAKGFCAIGSVKTNIGHLDAAAGVASLIKTVLALEHKLIPPSVNFERPNPQIDFENSPFYVNATLSEWKSDGAPRRAGVSSFGIGGTNAHVIVEEAPTVDPSSRSRPWQLLLLSAKTDSALEAATRNLADHLKQHPDLNLADVAYTYQVGRQAFGYRRMVVCRDSEDAVRTLETPDPTRVFTAFHEPGDRPVAFMFTGQGAQYVNMALELYQVEPTFREQVDLCSELLKPHLGFDLRDLLYPAEEQAEEAAERLKQTFITQPALFVIEYALARLWMEWGIRPQAMIGHSIGEYVAACMAGVFSLEDALALVAARGRMMQSLPGGAMLSVPLSEDEVRSLLNEKLSLAVINAPTLCVISGPPDAVDELEARLVEKDVAYRRLHTSHAFHSPMMDPILETFTERVAQVDLHPPRPPFISNVTGTWITAEEATDPSYWARHLRHTVRFADGVGELLKEPARILLEVGPGRTLSTLTRQHPDARGDRIVLSSVRHPKDQQSDVAFLLNTLGKLWLAGVRVDWDGFYAHERRHRLPLPTYPFERKRYWIEPGERPFLARPAELRKKPDVAEWFYVPSWKRADLSITFEQASPADQETHWLLFTDGDGLGAQMAERLEQKGQKVVTVAVGTRFERVGEHSYTLNPRERDDYIALIQDLIALDKLPAKIVHLWSATPGVESVEEAQDLGFYSLLFLAQTLGKQNVTTPLQINVVSTNVQEVTGEEVLRPEKVTVLGPCKVIPQEYPNVTCRSVDVLLPEPGTPQRERLIDKLIAEFAAEPSDLTVAYRGHHRWVQTFEPVRWDGAAEGPGRLREGGVYLITGGLGRIGLVLADYLAQTMRARLILVGRSAFPARDEWEQWLATHDDQDPISRKIRKVQALEALGAEVMVASADVADQAQMQEVITRAYERFGALHGLIHAAGIVGEKAVKSIREADRTACEQQFHPKVHGLLVLEKVLQGKELDFCLLQSSLSSVLGGLGFAAYSAANHFMDAFAYKRNQASPVPWISVNWDGWRFGEEQPTPAGTTVAELSITPEEGVKAFQLLLSLGAASQIVVSTGELQARIEQWVKRESVPEAEIAEEIDLHPRPSLQTAYVAPRNDLEQTIATMWQKVLGIEQVGVHDNFFELGGHSLLATQIISRLRDLFKVELPLRNLFENPTVVALAELIEAGRQAAAGLSAPSIEPIPRDGELPLSFGQQRLWFLDRLEPGSPLYNNFAALRLTGTLNVSALEQCLNEIVRRHESLRTTFSEAEGQPIQIIVPELTLSLPVVDLTHLSEVEQEAKVLELAVQEARQSFDLTHGPLLRVTLLRLAEDGSPGGGEHVIFVTMHHIISDGWSVGVLIQEVAALYEAFSAGKPSPLPELPIQYADYAHWQRQWLQGEVLETQIAYWKQQLDHPPVLELPTDRPRPAIQTSRGANQWFELPQNLSQALEDLSQQEGATLFMTLTAALQTLLYRYTEQEDICVGSPIANRNRAETEGLIGFLLNTLVIRTDLSGDVTFRELLGRVREVALGAYAHQDLPFEMLVEALQPERDMSRSPLFQVMFDLQIAPLPALELPDLTFSLLKVDNGTAKFDLALSMEQGEDGLSGYLNYNTDLFDAATITRMLGHFHTLLEGIVADPGQRISALPLLAKAERQQLLVEWNHTAIAPKRYQSIPRLFEAQVEQRPDAVAVILNEKQLSYGELNRRANQLAHYLRKLGVGPEVIVGLLVERSVEAMVGILGILKAGGAYLPLDPANPRERLAFILGDAQVPVLLTHSHLADGLYATRNTQHVYLDTDWERIAQESDENPVSEATAESLVYVIYTSGSTGKPKGVLISNGAIANHCRDIREHFELSASDRVLQFASYVFDQSVEQILVTLTTGATLVLRGIEVWPPADFSRVVSDFGLTVVNLPPAYWHQWVQDWDKAGVQVPEDQLRLVIIGGDVVLPETLRLWQSTPMRSARLLNAYGPTETTITALTYDIPPGFDGSRVPIGRPPANRTIYILDKRGEPVPVGVPGELHMGGAGLARGYLKRPELTAASFIPDPFPPPSVPPLAGGGTGGVGARLYKTGDLARYLPDGNVEFLGRVDHQVKLRGFRIELGEIETVLGRHQAVREAVVLAWEDEPGSKRLVAYVVPTAEHPSSLISELRSSLKESLPEYMVPSAFVTLDALPLTSSGKVDRRALPAPDRARPELGGAYVAPRTLVEEELVRMWAEVLNVERVGVHDNFFDLGGHSLMATQLISRVRATYQVDLPLRRLFETPTVAGLATLIEETLVEQEDDEELAQLLAELEGLSEDEARELLTGETSLP